MKVKAAPGLTVPKEGAPRQYIGSDVVDVPGSPYYRRLVKDGSLILETDKARKSKGGDQ